MCCENEHLTEELNPTFLYTWKGTRTYNEPNYHSHENCIELNFVLSGSGKYRIDDQIYEVTEGDIIFINPGMYHQALTDGKGKPATEFFIGFTDINFYGMKPNYFSISDSPVFHTSGELRQKISKLISSMDTESAGWKPGRYFMLRSYLVQLLLLLVRTTHQTPAESQKGYAFESVNRKYIVEQIISYFEDHYAERISLDQIAENIYLSPFYINKLFKHETGETPIRYLINIRLEHAKELLEQGKCISIQDVAGQVGYDDAYHFSKLFKKKYGMSPSQVWKHT